MPNLLQSKNPSSERLRHNKNNKNEVALQSSRKPSVAAAAAAATDARWTFVGMDDRRTAFRQCSTLETKQYGERISQNLSRVTHRCLALSCVPTAWSVNVQRLQDVGVSSREDARLTGVTESGKTRHLSLVPSCDPVKDEGLPKRGRERGRYAPSLPSSCPDDAGGDSRSTVEAVKMPLRVVFSDR